MKKFQLGQENTKSLLKYVKFQIIIEDNGVGISPENL